MQPAPFPTNESDRLAALQRYGILDTEAEELFDSIAKLAASICDVPIALVSLVDENRQWFKAKVGIDADETHRDQAFCAHAILEPEELLVVPDATQDSRFAENPLVTGGPEIRFYAGAPIVTPDNHPLGTLCVIDREKRELTEAQQEALRQLSKQVCVNLDLRLSNKRLAELNESKNKFFSVLAHDLRSPLNSVLSIAQLLNDPSMDLSDEEETEFKAHLLTSTKVTLDIAENLLQLIQFERGKFNFEPAALDLQAEVEKALQGLEGRARAKRVTIENKIGPDSLSYVDPHMLQSILQNLISNALKFSHPDATITLTAESVTCKAGRRYAVSVTDTGVGMKPEQLSKLFSLDGTHSTPGTDGEKGSGLGLTLCKNFAERMGGDLEIESEAGKGTRAILTIPAVDPLASQKAS